MFDLLSNLTGLAPIHLRDTWGICSVPLTFRWSLSPLAVWAYIIRHF
ncbi:MAG: hypothetical protein V8S87_01065 [Oscillospiraceae bacterium]